MTEYLWAFLISFGGDIFVSVIYTRWSDTSIWFSHSLLEDGKSQKAQYIWHSYSGFPFHNCLYSQWSHSDPLF